MNNFNYSKASFIPQNKNIVWSWSAALIEIEALLKKLEDRLGKMKNATNPNKIAIGFVEEQVLILCRAINHWGECRLDWPFILNRVAEEITITDSGIILLAGPLQNAKLIRLNYESAT